MERFQKSFSKMSMRDYNRNACNMAHKFTAFIMSLLADEQFISLSKNSQSAIPFCHFGSRAFAHLCITYNALFEAKLPSDFLIILLSLKNNAKKSLKSNLLDLCIRGKERSLFLPFDHLDEFHLESRQFWKYETFRFSLQDDHCTVLTEFFGDYIAYITRSLHRLDEYDQVDSRKCYNLPK